MLAHLADYCFRLESVADAGSRIVWSSSTVIYTVKIGRKPRIPLTEVWPRPWRLLREVFVVTTRARRDELHGLVDALPAQNLDVAARVLRRIGRAKSHQTVEEALASAPVGFTEEDVIEAIAEARADVAAGRIHPQAQIERDLSS